MKVTLFSAVVTMTLATALANSVPVAHHISRRDHCTDANLQYGELECDEDHEIPELDGVGCRTGKCICDPKCEFEAMDETFTMCETGFPRKHVDSCPVDECVDLDEYKAEIEMMMKEGDMMEMDGKMDDDKEDRDDMDSDMDDDMSDDDDDDDHSDHEEDDDDDDDDYE